LPGFVVRAASLENPSGEHIFDMVRKEASAASGTELEYGPDFTVGKITGEGDVGLHADNQPSDSDKETYHVHQTTEGKARISLANQGPKAGDINVRLDERLRGLAEEGKTDPDHMSAVVHTGEVERGDTVVFRVSGKNPTWHNVESLTPDRASSVAVMLPKPQETPKPHDGIW
ncbi:MAG TPA: hypothetical protein VLE73_00190, partial [Candidatus Saccharimonadales bacterium]|nr:hypothetical protein [Candidatus Saccharimonadales bacterium]